MSRSFGKIGKGYSIGWDGQKRMRVRERLMIHREMMSLDYGDVIFPTMASEFWSSRHNMCYMHRFSFKKRIRDYKTKIRDKYFLEIRNILNGHYGYIGQTFREYLRGNVFFDEIFMEEYRRIKGLVPDDGREFSFEWLELKAVRKVIKTWSGEPFEVLRYLTQHGFIEQAVCREFKMTTSK
jgi:hypothetical protein